jgi:hypothetical protein
VNQSIGALALTVSSPVVGTASLYEHHPIHATRPATVRAHASCNKISVAATRSTIKVAARRPPVIAVIYKASKLVLRAA